jgi:uridine kinase
MRDQLSPFWDYSIFLDITFDEAMNRGLKRDIHYFKDQKQLIEKYNKRYLPAQSMYLSDVKPKELVNMVIDHNDFKNPRILLERS